MLTIQGRGNRAIRVLRIYPEGTPNRSHEVSVQIEQKRKEIKMSYRPENWSKYSIQKRLEAGRSTVFYS